MTTTAVDLEGHAFQRDPAPTYRRLRAQGAVIRTRIPLLGRVALLTTHAAGSAMLRDPERFVVDARKVGEKRASGLEWWVPNIFRPLADNLLAHDDPDHRRLRSLVDLAFRRRSVDSYHARITELADGLLDDMAAGTDADLMRHYARALPLAVICELLGLPGEDRPRFTRWLESLSTVATPIGIFRSLPATKRITQYLKAQFARRRAVPEDDLISALVQASAEQDRLSEDELLGMCFLLFLAGHETTTHLIGGGVLALLQHPAELARLQSDWALAPRAVEELLRHVSPVLITRPRFAAARTELGGDEIAPGESVCVLVGAANSDPEVFALPDTLDIARERNRHLSFGGGPHTCLGLQLARLETRIALQRLFRRFPTLVLAVPESELRWRGRTGLRALTRLPVKLGG